MENSNLKTGNNIIDGIASCVEVAITAICLLYAENVPVIHINMPVFLMEFTQWGAWMMTICVGFLTLMGMLGYEPRWLKKIKSFFKKKSL